MYFISTWPWIFDRPTPVVEMFHPEISAACQSKAKVVRRRPSLQLIVLLESSFSLRSQMQSTIYETQTTPLNSTDRFPLLRLCGRSSRTLWCTSLEAILEHSRHALHVTHTASASCLPPLSLLAPVVCHCMLAFVPQLSQGRSVESRAAGSNRRRTLPNLSRRVSA